MTWIWRAVLAALVVGVPAFWSSTTTTDAAAQFVAGSSDVRGPVADNVNDNDPDELCGSSNPRKQKKCHYNGWDLNTNDNDVGIVLASDSSMSAGGVTVDGLTVELFRTAETPVINAPLVVSVKGQGAAIQRVWWWAEGPVPSGPFTDDLAAIGTMNYDCAGAQPCAWSWPVVARYVGPYTVHARVRDTSGREVQTDWKFTSVN